MDGHEPVPLHQSWEGSVKLPGNCLLHLNQDGSEAGARCQTDGFLWHQVILLVPIPGTSQEKAAQQLPSHLPCLGPVSHPCSRKVLRPPEPFAFLLFLQQFCVWCFRGRLCSLLPKLLRGHRLISVSFLADELTNLPVRLEQCLLGIIVQGHYRRDHN